MAGEHSFSIDFNELDTDLQACIDRYPDETASFLRKEANKWKKDCNSKGYGKYTGGKRPVPKSWKTVNEENIVHQVTAVSIQNQSPLFHLLENGHDEWFMGKRMGKFVPGKHWAEKTREEWKELFKGKVEDYVSRMLGRHNL